MTPEMEYIYTVYQEGSFSKAAQKLYLTQPALSIAIRKVEQSIGMSLFDRKRKPLQLTAAGKIYIDTIKKMLLLEEEQQQKLNDIQNLVTGTIRLGGTHYLNAYILPKLLASFSRLHPGVQLQISEQSSYKLSQMLASRELDITFNCSPNLVKDFVSYAMFEDRVLLAVPSDDPFNKKYTGFALTAAQICGGQHLLQNCPKLPLRALAEPELILLRKGNNLYERACEIFEQAGISPKVKLDLNQLVTAYHMAEAGMAATLVSDRIIKTQRDTLCYYSLDTPIATRVFYILLAKDAYTPVAVRRFVEHALQWMHR